LKDQGKKCVTVSWSIWENADDDRITKVLDEGLRPGPSSLFDSGTSQQAAVEFLEKIRNAQKAINGVAVVIMSANSATSGGTDRIPWSGGMGAPEGVRVPFIGRLD
jgi:hypothetical protein